MSQRRKNMIYTITFNPALDYVIKMQNLKIGKINKNVSRNVE